METLDDVAWRKSSYSGTNGGDCVEAAAGARVVLVRDTADRGGVVLNVPSASWRLFLQALR